MNEQIVWSLFTAVVLIAIYFMPSLNAIGAKHNNKAPIILTNLFFGWTVIGWFLALIWSFSSNKVKG